MPPPSSSDIKLDEPRVDKVVDSQPPTESIEPYFDEAVIDGITEKYGLAAFSGALKTTLTNAGVLFLRYSFRNANGPRDLAPKCRNIARMAEIARNLDRELVDLDFWDKWQIFKRLEQTSHPVTDSFDTHSTANPMIAGNAIIEEIRLILNVITRYERDFFLALDQSADGRVDMGLYFFTKVLSSYWESVTGEDLTSVKQASPISPRAIDFLAECVAPLASIERREIEDAIRRL